MNGATIKANVTYKIDKWVLTFFVNKLFAISEYCSSEISLSLRIIFDLMQVSNSRFSSIVPSFKINFV
jgi:hypothetical protein